MKTFKLSFYRPSNHSAWAYFNIRAADSERAIARANKEIERLNRLKDSEVPWTLNRLEEVEKQEAEL